MCPLEVAENDGLDVKAERSSAVVLLSVLERAACRNVTCQQKDPRRGVSRQSLKLSDVTSWAQWYERLEEQSLGLVTRQTSQSLHIQHSNGKL